MKQLALICCAAGSVACDSYFYDVYDAGVAASDAAPPDAANVCPPLATRRINLERSAREETRLLLALDPAAEKIFTTVSFPARYFELGPNSPVVERDTLSTPNFIARDGVALRDQVWLSGLGSQVWRGEIVSGSVDSLEFVASTTLAGDLTFLDGVSTSSGIVLWMMGTWQNESGALIRFDGAEFSRVWGPGRSVAGFGHAGVVAISASEAYAVPRHGACLENEACVLHFSEGRVVEEVIFDEIPTTVAFVEPHGVVAGTKNGALFRRETSSRWTALGERRLPDFAVPGQEATWVREIVAGPNGSVVFVSDTWLGKWTPEEGTCEPTVIGIHAPLGHVFSAEKFGAGFVFAGAPLAESFLGVVEP